MFLCVIFASSTLFLNRDENVTLKVRCMESMDWTAQVQFPALQDLFSIASTLTEGPIQPPVQSVPGLTTPLQLLLRS
jgi:hypothetical protein